MKVQGYRVPDRALCAAMAYIYASNELFQAAGLASLIQDYISGDLPESCTRYSLASMIASRIIQREKRAGRVRKHARGWIPANSK